MAIQTTNITLDGLVHTLDDRDRVAAQLVNENANTFSGVNIFSGGKRDSNVTKQSGTAAEDLTATASDLVWYASTAQAANITLPDATASNVGMVIKIIVGTTDWSTTAFKLGFADSGTCVLTGYMHLMAADGAASCDGFVITANAQSLQIDANDPATAIGGSIGATYTFTYL